MTEIERMISVGNLFLMAVIVQNQHDIQKILKKESPYTNRFSVPAASLFTIGLILCLRGWLK